MRELLQLALTALASPLLGGDEKSLRQERTTKQPFPSSLGSCELWSPAGRRYDIAMQHSPPATAPGVSLEPWSCPPPNSVGFWGHTLHPCTVQTACSPPKALEVPLPWGGGLSVSIWPSWRPFSSGDRWGLLSFCSLPPELSLGPLATSVHPRGCCLWTRQPHNVQLYVCTLETTTVTLTESPSPRITCSCLHPLCPHSQTKTADNLNHGTHRQRHTEQGTGPAAKFPTVATATATAAATLTALAVHGHTRPTSTRAAVPTPPSPGRSSKISNGRPTAKSAAITAPLGARAATDYRHSTDQP